MSALTDLSDTLMKAYNSADVAALADCYAPDAVQRHPFFPDGNHGRDAIHAAEGGMFSAFSDIDWKLVRIIEDGEWGAIETLVSATNTADMPTPDGNVVPATNRRVTIPLVNLIRLDGNGLIAEEHRYMDVAGMMGQLGLLS